MKAPISLAKYSQQVYEYTMVKRLEERVSQQQKKQQFILSGVLLALGAIGLGMIMGSIELEELIKQLILKF